MRGDKPQPMLRTFGLNTSNAAGSSATGMAASKMRSASPSWRTWAMWCSRTARKTAGVNSTSSLSEVNAFNNSARGARGIDSGRMEFANTARSR